MSRLSKKELVGQIAESHEISKAAAHRIVSEVFGTMRTTLESGGSIYMPELGTFKISQRQARKIFVPANGLTNVPARKVVKFLPAASLRESVKSVKG